MQILDLLLGRPNAYRHAVESSRAPLWMAVCLLVTGAVYGGLLARFQQTLGGELQQGIPVAEIPGPILYGGNVVAGILVALVFHGGVTLVLWLMARAVGGPGRLGVLYRAGAYLLPLSLPALPYLAADSVVGQGVSGELPLAWAYPFLALGSLALVLPGLYHLLRTTQGLGGARAIAASGLFLLFCVSIVLVL